MRVKRFGGQQQALVALLSLPSLTLALPVLAENTSPKEQVIENETVSVQIEALDPFEAEQERLKKLIAEKPPAYKDKFMQPLELLSFEAEDAKSQVEPEGQSSYTLESRVNFFKSSNSVSDASQFTEAGVHGEYRTETRDYGDVVLQFDGRTQDAANPSSAQAYQDNHERITLRNEALALTETISADTTLGDQSSSVTTAFARSGRVALNSESVRGISTKVKGQKFDLRAGYGKRSRLVGGPYPAYDAQEGDFAWLGYSKAINDHWVIGVQTSQARDLPITELINSQRSLANIHTLAATIDYASNDYLIDGEAKRARVTWLQSRTDHQQTDNTERAQGIFAEASLKKGKYRHEFGAYQVEPELRYGSSIIASGKRGVYWRVDRQQVRWQASGGLDLQDDNSSQTDNQDTSQHLGLDANARYQLTHNKYIGGYARLSQQKTDAENNTGSRALNANIYYEAPLKPWGNARLNLALKRNDLLATNAKVSTGEEIQWQQNWIREQYETMRPELTTTLGVAHDRSEKDTQVYPTAGVTLRHWINPDWNLAANLRYSSRHGNLSTSQGLSGGISTEKTLNRSWKIGASISANEAKVEATNPLDNKPLVSRSRDVIGGIYLSWEDTIGKPYQRLGGKGLAGSGVIAGKVFADANKDGKQQDDEVGLGGVEVTLDGNYQTTTDHRGNYTFDRVATGKHELSLNLNSLPLPWGLKESQQIKLSVPLRGRVTQDIATQNISH